MTWVVSDYTATPGTNEVSVTKGQQVEIIETPNSEPSEFCLVRLGPMGSGDGGTHEGLVPISILKPPPTAKGVARRGLEVEKEQTESNGKSIFRNGHLRGCRLKSFNRNVQDLKLYYFIVH